VNALKGSSIVLIIGFLISVAAFPVKASTPTLADQLNAAISTVDWVSPQSWVIPHFSLIFTGQNIYDTVLPAISDFKTLIQTKRIAELDDINSSFLNQLVAQAMDNQTMVGHWPNVDPHLMSVYWKYMVSAYRYAMELGSNTSKWDRDLAYEEFLRCWQADPDFLWFDAQNRTLPGPTGGDRYYDENAQVLSIFLKFYQIGVTDAINYATQMWTHLYINHWNSARDYFPYSPTSPQAECEAGPFAETIGELYASNRNGLPNFPDYILRDLDYKFISGGNWSAKLWSPGAYVVRHAETNPEKRLENTVTAWAAMQSYYGVMNRSMQTNFVNLLAGSPSAWQGLIDNSGLFKDGRFRWRENANYTDDATCGGMMTLFLNGIVPESGSLAIPVIDEVYQDWYSMFPASHFRFDYASRTIRIPVWAGKINFILGTEPASYNFSENGIYEIHFSTDWNSVTDANLVNPLNSKFAYLDPTHRDIAVTNLRISKSVIEKGYLGSVNVTIENQGVANETFNVTVYANATAIFQQPIGLSAGTNCTVSFDWNTSKFAYGDYIVIADVEPLPKETDTSDNNFNASVHVGVPGDISGPVPGVHDGKCDFRDINYLVIHFNTHSRSLNWNPNCDIDGSGRVDIRDIFIALLNFNKRE
jgi:hypothetical protein